MFSRTRLALGALLCTVSRGIVVTKSPRTSAVISAGAGHDTPTFICDPGVLADSEGLHIFVSNIFCARSGNGIQTVF